MTVLLVGDDWAADHHDAGLMDQAGRVLARARLSEGAAGMARLHALVGEHAGDGDGEDELEVRVGIETDHGPWVMALAAAGYAVFAVNPLQAARYRDRHAVSGAKSDTGDGHILAAWSGPTRTSCGRSQPTLTRRRRSRWWPAPVRR